MSVAVYGVAFGLLYGRTSIKCHCLVLAKLGSPSSLDSKLLKWVSRGCESHELDEVP